MQNLSIRRTILKFILFKELAHFILLYSFQQAYRSINVNQRLYWFQPTILKRRYRVNMTTP